MIYFDYLFYLIYKFYSRKEKNAATSSAGVVGALQAINLLTLIMLILSYADISFSLSKLFGILVVIVFQITTYVRYIYKDKISIPAMEEQWFKMHESKKVRMRALATIYVALSVIAFFGIAIVLSLK